MEPTATPTPVLRTFRVLAVPGSGHSYTFWEVKPFGFEQIEPPKFVHDGGPDLMAYKMNPLWEALRDNVVANYEQRGLGSGWERHHSDPRPHFQVALATPVERKQISADDQAKRDAEPVFSNGREFVSRKEYRMWRDGQRKLDLTLKLAEVLETKLAAHAV
jgi:hypothetical protein